MNRLWKNKLRRTSDDSPDGVTADRSQNEKLLESAVYCGYMMPSWDCVNERETEPQVMIS